jgi:hypothetical protein
MSHPIKITKEITMSRYAQVKILVTCSSVISVTI